MVPFRFETTPYDHQYRELVDNGTKPAWAHFWDPGTGKTKEILDQFTWFLDSEKVDALLVIAPNGVHRNWITEELGVHLPPDILRRAAVHYYQSSKASTKWHQRACADVLEHRGPVVLAMTYDGIMTPRGKKYAKQFLTKRRCLYVLDEAHRIKTASSKRSRTVVASRVHAEYRRVLTGTPATNGPFNLWQPIRFLDDTFWPRHGLPDYQTFKTFFGIWERKYNAKQDRQYDQCVGYKNLHLLQEWLKEISTTIALDDVLDLPQSRYTELTFDLTAQQRRLYDDLVQDFSTRLESGEEVTAPLAITRLLRLQQVTCGYLKPDDEEDLSREHVLEDNPRLDLLGEILADLRHKAIVWCRFHMDIDLIMEKCKKLGLSAGQYDGRTSEQERARVFEAFQKGDMDVFVSNPATAGTGLTLHSAKTVIYYSNSFDLEHRLQSERRARRAGMDDRPVHYIDLVAPGTVDRNITRALKRKTNVQAQITGANMMEWV